MYWIAWDVQMAKEATGKLQKQQPGTLKTTLTLSIASAIIKLITRECFVFFLCSHEGEMYKSLLCDYEASQRSLMQENAELKKVLQQLKKDMIHILSPCKSNAKETSANDCRKQVFFFSSNRSWENNLIL